MDLLTKKYINSKEVYPKNIKIYKKTNQWQKTHTYNTTAQTKTSPDTTEKIWHQQKRRSGKKLWEKDKPDISFSDKKCCDHL